jgi:hypothetical protein
MKRPITATGLLTLLAMIVVGVFSTGSALAVPQFLWTGPLPALVLVLSDNPQVFTAAPGLEIVCQHFGGHGIASNGKAMSTKEITINGVYSRCTAPAAAAPVVVTPASFLLGADGSVGIKNTIVITVGSPVGCSLKINPEEGNNTLKTIRYLNNPSGDLLAHVEVEKIVSLGSNGACGLPSEEKATGTYRGLLLVSVDGGSLRWDS